MNNITINSNSFDHISSLENIQVPPYQREYCWDKKDCQQLINDIINIINVNKSDQPKHYMGSLVFLVHSEKQYAIIDGQQRITSISLLLLAIRCLLKENSNEVLKPKYEDSLKSIDAYLYTTTANKEQKLRLKHLNHDADIYKDLLENYKNLENKDNKANKVIKNNFQFFLEELKKNNYIKNHNGENEKIDFLNNILKIIKEDLIFAFVQIPNNDLNTAQKIFESLNNTGKKLTQADLIRNFVLMPEISSQNTTDKQKDLYNEWQRDVEKKLQSIDNTDQNLDDFFRHYLIARTGSKIKETEIYSRFKKFVEEKKYQDKTIYRDVIKVAKIYHQIKCESNIKELKLFRALKLWSLMPLMIVIFESENELKNNFISVIKLIINYGFRMSSVDTTNKIKAETIVHQLTNEPDWQNNPVTILSAILNMPKDDEVKNALSTRNITKGGFNLYRFILMFIEEAQRSDKNVIDYNTLQIEHILPQKPSEKFKNEHTDWKEISKNNAGKLGNITLITPDKNSKISNDDIKSKIDDYYNKSDFKINQDIEGLYNDATKNIVDFISKRAEKLIKKVLEGFPYYCDENYKLNNNDFNKEEEEEPDLTLDGTDIELKNNRGEISGKRPKEMTIIINNEKTVLSATDGKKYTWKKLYSDFDQFLTKKYKNLTKQKKLKGAHKILIEMSNLCTKVNIDPKNVKIYWQDEVNEF